MTRLLTIVALLLAGCTDFTDVPRGVCGNGLLEPGEDCDSDDASCVRCAVTCNPGGCPSDAYTCGVDGFCHAPGGELAQPSAPVTFQVDDLRITDADKDGIGDVIGVSKTSITLRKGDATGALATATSFVTPAPSGPPAFGDLDGDHTIDITLPTPDGIVSYTSRFGVLAPVAIESPVFDGATNQPLDFQRLFQVSRVELGGMIVDPASGATLLIVVGFGSPQQVSGGAPCAGRLGPLQPSQIVQSTVDIYRVTPDAAFDTELVVSFLTQTGALCVSSLHGNLLAGYTIDDITPVGANGMTAKPILADLDTDADRCPGLVNSDAGAQALRIWDGDTVGGHCILKPAGLDGAPLPTAPAAPSTAAAIGRIELVPPIPGFGRDALVMTSGVYAHVPVAAPPFIPQPTLLELYSSNGRQLAFVATGDLDNDNKLDAVLATADQDDLDVLFRFDAGLQLLRIDTASHTTSLTLGDYDGNGILDIAYSETNGTHQDMMVAYGTTDRPLEPTRVATFSAVGSVSPIEFPDSVDTLNIATDLAILQPGSTTSLLSIIHGSPQRTMLSFFDPRTQAFKQSTVLRGAIVGDFVEPSAPDTHHDLIAIAASANGTLRAWRAGGSAAGLDTTPNDGGAATGLSDCSGGTGVCIRSAHYLSWPTSPNHDVIIAVDQETPSHAQVLDPFANSNTNIETLFSTVPAGAVIRSLHAADLDGDGANELIASFRSSTGEGAVLVCRMSAAGVPQQCDDVTATIQALDDAVTSCIDAAPGIFRDGTQPAAPGRDLVVLCTQADTAALYRIAGGVATALGAHAPGMTALEVGDVTGDGVDDVVALIGNGGSQAVVSFVQCTSRDIGACRSAAAQGAGQ